MYLKQTDQPVERLSAENDREDWTATRSGHPKCLDKGLRFSSEIPLLKLRLCYGWIVTINAMQSDEQTLINKNHSTPDQT